jgi:hypothetical protein
MMGGNIIQMEVRRSENQLLPLFFLFLDKQCIKKRSQRGRRNSRRREDKRLGREPSIGPANMKLIK